MTQEFCTSGRESLSKDFLFCKQENCMSQVSMLITITFLALLISSFLFNYNESRFAERISLPFSFSPVAYHNERVPVALMEVFVIVVRWCC